MERTDLPICHPSEPEIPYQMDICNVYATFNDSADRLISVGFTNASTDDPNGFFQHTFGGNTSPSCNLIPLFPALVCDSYITVGLDCDDGTDGSATDPDFDGTLFNTAGQVVGGWYNIDPSNGQGVPDANGRVLIAQFSVKQNRNVSGALSVFATIGGAQDATEFPLQAFDCSTATPGSGGGTSGSSGGSGPVAQGQGAGTAGSPGCGEGGTCLCPDIEFGGANEPAIAVNPLNPLNIAVAWNPDLSGEDQSPAQLTVSTDGGQTWCGDPCSPCPAPTEAVLPQDPCSDENAFCRISGDPSLAFDSTGRLYWAYAAVIIPTPPHPYFSAPADFLVLEVDSTTGEVLAGPVRVINNEEMAADKAWLTADSTIGSPYANRLYLTWNNRHHQPIPYPELSYIAVSYAEGLEGPWSAPIALSETDGSDRAFAAHIAAAPNGDVYVAYHIQPGVVPGGNPDGVSGQIIVRRSMDGGVSWDEQDPSVAYQPGDADITWNFQDSTGNIPQTRFCGVGSSQPWIVPDPSIEGRVYIVAADDPDNVHGDLEDSRIRIVASNDFGQTWDDLLDPEGKPRFIEPDVPAATFQVFPTAAIDRETGDIVVLWYDNRNGVTFQDPLDPQGPELFYLDLFFSVSTDQGASFSAPLQINDLPLDHVSGATATCLSHPNTTRMGEYIGVALTTDTSGTQHLYAAWTGNDDTGQQIFFGTDQCDGCPWDADDDGSVGAFDLAVVLGDWGTNPCGPPDFDGDGDVDAADLAQLLGRWGPCP